MSKIYQLFVADEGESQQICNLALNGEAGVLVPAFDESKQLSLLSLFGEICDPAANERFILQRAAPVIPSVSDEEGDAGTEARNEVDLDDATKSMLANIAAKSARLEESYYKHFKLVYPSVIGAECAVTKFHDDFVSAVAAVSDAELPGLTSRWIAIEPSLSGDKWSKVDVERLFVMVRQVCIEAKTRRKSVLCRLSL